jgi:hypothetical protein
MFAAFPFQEAGSSVKFQWNNAPIQHPGHRYSTIDPGSNAWHAVSGPPNSRHGSPVRMPHRKEKRREQQPAFHHARNISSTC